MFSLSLCSIDKYRIISDESVITIDDTESETPCVTLSSDSDSTDDEDEDDDEEEENPLVNEIVGSSTLLFSSSFTFLFLSRNQL